MDWTGIIVMAALIVALVGGALLFLPGNRRVERIFPLIKDDGRDPTLGFRDPYR